MRDPKRIAPLLKAVHAVWLESPDLRLGQLLANLADDFPHLYNMEDDELLRRLRDLYRR